MVTGYVSERHQNISIMSGLLYLIAVILIIAWILGFFVFHVSGGLIHILLVIAIIAVLLRLIRGEKV